MMQKQQRMQNEAIDKEHAIVTNKPTLMTSKDDLPEHHEIQTKPLTPTLEDSRNTLLEKYQPDLVRDVPEHAIGSPETPLEFDHSLDYRYDHKNEEEKEEFENVGKEDGLLQENKSPEACEGEPTNGKIMDSNKCNPNKDLQCFSLLKELLLSIVKPIAFAGRKFHGADSVSPNNKTGRNQKGSTGESGSDECWEIKIEEIDEMHWIGSGAQGAVFLGRWRNEEVAIKKVRSQRDTCTKHLRNLDHDNIVKFRYVKCC